MVGWWSRLICFFLGDGVLTELTWSLYWRFVALSTGVLGLLALHWILVLLMVRSIYTHVINFT